MSGSIEGLTVDQVYGLAQLTHTLANDPRTRESFLSLVKQGNPNISIPEIDAKNQVLAQLEQERQARVALEARIQEKEIRENLERKKADVQSRFKFSTEDMASVEKIMLDEQIPSYETAAKYFQASRQVAAASFNPSSMESHQVSLPDASVWKNGFGNQAALNKIAQDEAYKALNEISSNNFQ